jgi:hypothetical protein
MEQNTAITFLVETESWGIARVIEISYERRGKEMLTGVKKIRDVVGRSYYVASRVAICLTTDMLNEALDRAQKHIARHQETLIKNLTEVAMERGQP